MRKYNIEKELCKASSLYSVAQSAAENLFLAIIEKYNIPNTERLTVNFHGDLEICVTYEDYWDFSFQQFEALCKSGDMAAILNGEKEVYVCIRDIEAL